MRLGNKLRIRYLFVGYLGIFLGFAIYSVYAYFFTPSVLIVTILGFWLVALLSYAIVESPFLRLRRQWSRSSADVERDPTGALERESGGGPRIEGSPAVRVRDA